MSAYFVTAIGTDAGKTYTSCALLHAARNQGRAVAGLKPIVSGWVDDGHATDTSQLIAASGVGTVEDITPWRYAAPLSPHRAAVLEGREVPFDAVVAWSRNNIARADFTLIEGVGGLMAPLTNEKTGLDWMVALGLPVILVTNTYLGSISHTLTALGMLKQAGLPIAALVMNESACSSVTLAEAEAGLAPFVTDIALRAVQPRVDSWKEATALHALAEQLA